MTRVWDLHSVSFRQVRDDRPFWAPGGMGTVIDARMFCRDELRALRGAR